MIRSCCASNTVPEPTYSHDSILGLALRGRADIGLLTRSWLKERQIREPALQAQLLVGEQVDQTYRHYMLPRPQARLRRLGWMRCWRSCVTRELQRIFEPYGVQVSPQRTGKQQHVAEVDGQVQGHGRPQAPTT